MADLAGLPMNKDEASEQVSENFLYLSQMQATLRACMRGTLDLLEMKMADCDELEQLLSILGKHQSLLAQALEGQDELLTQRQRVYPFEDAVSDYMCANTPWCFQGLYTAQELQREEDNMGKTQLEPTE